MNDDLISRQALIDDFTETFGKAGNAVDDWREKVSEAYKSIGADVPIAYSMIKVLIEVSRDMLLRIVKKQPSAEVFRIEHVFVDHDRDFDTMRDYFADGKVRRIIENAYEHGRLEASPRLIPVSERLPEIDMSHPHHVEYLVQYDSGHMDVASWSNVNRFWTGHVTEPYWNSVQFAEVIAWMPLPQPWKGVDE